MLLVSRKTDDKNRSSVLLGYTSPIHHFEVNGVSHFANTAEPAVPEALADFRGGFLGLHDFQPEESSHDSSGTIK